MTTLNPDLSKPICRVCLQSNHGEEMSSIFNVNSNFCDVHIYEKIEQCANIKILRHEKMPSLICGDCYRLLEVSYRFRTMCRNSNEYLEQFVVVGLAIPKIEESLDQNPLTISKNISTDIEINSQYKTTLRDCPEIIKNEEICLTLSSTNSKEFIDDDFDGEEWFDIDYQDDDISCVENDEFSLEKMDLDPEKDMEHLKTKNCTVRKKTANTKKIKTETAPPKTLEITSDGTAIIREKKPRASRGKKENQPVICEICGNIYQRRYSLDLHMRKHRNEKPFECEICGHAFHSNFQLNRHMRKHTGARPYKCSYCPRAFGDQSTLIKHERVHRNERPFKCETCGKSFSYTGVLKYHKLIHTGEKPYACEICGKCFPQPHKLRAHLETLQHQSDPRTKTLLQNIRKNNEVETLKVENFMPQI